jgi:restriction endonuclease
LSLNQADLEASQRVVASKDAERAKLMKKAQEVERGLRLQVQGLRTRVDKMEKDKRYDH